MKQIVIIGAGLAGLSTAYHLGLKQNRCYTVFEKGDSPGGLCRTVNSNGFLFDYTGHFLHLRNNYVKKLVNGLLKGKLKKIYRNSWIYSKGIYTRYPFQENTCGLPPEVVRECVLGFIKAVKSKGKASRNQSFHDWILGHLGEGVARHFMVPYNKKMWTCHPRELTSRWLGPYVPKPTVREVADGALFDKKSRLGYNAFFYYPEKGGIQTLTDAFALSCKNLRLNTVVTKIDLENRTCGFRGNNSKSSGEIHFDALVSSMPLKELALKVIKNVPDRVRKAAKGLRYNSVLNINLGINRRNISDKHWIYFPEDKFVFYRVGFLMNFSDKLATGGTSSVYTEIAYKPIAYKPADRKKVSANRQKILKRVVRDLIKAGILRGRDKLLTTEILDIEYAYVIYDRNYEKNVGIIKDYLLKNGVYVIGRYGRWEYSAMEEAILEGRDAANECRSNLLELKSI